MRERNEHRQEEGEKVAEITKKSVKPKINRMKKMSYREEICRRITRVRKTHRRGEDLKGDGSRGDSGGEGRRNAGRLKGVNTRRGKGCSGTVATGEVTVAGEEA